MTSEISIIHKDVPFAASKIRCVYQLHCKETFGLSISSDNHSLDADTLEYILLPLSRFNVRGA